MFIQSPLVPLHVEVGGERDGVVIAADGEDLVDVNADADLVWLFCEWKLKFGIVFRKTQGFRNPSFVASEAAVQTEGG